MYDTTLLKYYLQHYITPLQQVVLYCRRLGGFTILLLLRKGNYY